MQNPHELLVEIDLLKERNKILEQEDNFLREQFKLAKARQFGPSSEKSPDQFDWLFNEAETIEDAEKIEVQEDINTDVAVTESTVATTNKKTGRKPLPSLLAHIIGNKYQFALPLYRQEMVFKQLNIDLNRKTLSNWMIRSAAVL